MNWFQWVDDQAPFPYWRAFHSALLQRFGQAQNGDPTEHLLSIKQETTVAEYRARFEPFVATARGLPDTIFWGAFLNGLREEIRTDVKIL